MMNELNFRNNSSDRCFEDRSWPSESERLAIDVFQLELILEDYDRRRRSSDYGYASFVCDADMYDEYALDDEEFLYETENELRYKRERLACISQ